MKPIYTVSYSTLSKLHGCPQRFIYQALLRKESMVTPTHTDTLFGNVWHNWRKNVAASKGDYNKALLVAAAEWNEGIKLGATARKKELSYLDVSWVMTNLMKLSHMMPWDNVEGFQYFKDAKGNALVEEKFSLPLIVDDRYELHLTGVFDAIGYLHNGKTLVIQDDKTTSFSWPEKFFEKYDHSAQMLLYVNVVKMLAASYPDSPIGQAVGKSGLDGVSILGVFHTKGGIELKRSPLFTYSERTLTENGLALGRLMNDFKQTIETYLDGGAAEKVGLATDACKDYGNEACPYLRACLCESREDEDAIIRSVFRTRPSVVDVS